MDVLSILRSKNRCIENLLALSREFLASARSESGNLLAGLDSFQHRRDAAIRALELYDRKVSELVSNLSPSLANDPELIEQVRASIENKALLVHELIQLDDEIIRAIEAEKERIQRDLLTSQKSTETLRKFKSGWMPESGEGLDTKL